MGTSFSANAIVQSYLIVDPKKVTSKNSQMIEEEAHAKEKQLNWYERLAKKMTDELASYQAKNLRASYTIRTLSKTKTETSNLHEQEKFEPAQTTCDVVSYIANTVSDCDFLYSDDTDTSSGIRTNLKSNSEEELSSVRYKRLYTRAKTDNQKNNTLDLPFNKESDLSKLAPSLASAYQQTMSGFAPSDLNPSRRELMDSIIELLVNAKEYQIAPGQDEYNSRMLSLAKRQQLLSQVMKSSYIYRTTSGDKQSKTAILSSQFNDLQESMKNSASVYKSLTGTAYRPPLTTIERDEAINNIINLKRTFYIYQAYKEIEMVLAIRTQILNEISENKIKLKN